MKLYGQTKVMVPWYDDQGMKQWMMLTFNPKPGVGIDKRWLLKEIIKHIAKQEIFNYKQVSTTWVKKNCAIVNSEAYDLDISHDSAYEAFIEAMVERLEYKEGDEIDDEAASAGEAEDASEAGAEVRPVSDTTAEAV